MVQILRRFLADTYGATAIEYALIASLISLGALTAMGSMGASLSDMFGFVSAQLALPGGEVTQCVSVDSSCDK